MGYIFSYWTFIFLIRFALQTVCATGPRLIVLVSFDRDAGMMGATECRLRVFCCLQRISLIHLVLTLLYKSITMVSFRAACSWLLAILLPGVARVVVCIPLELPVFVAWIAGWAPRGYRRTSILRMHVPVISNRNIPAVCV